MSRARRIGFTLVELLVVSAIVAVLVAILLPALSHARQQAQLVQCSSNTRQILLAMFMYAQDNRGRLPIPQTIGIDPPAARAIWWLGDGQYDWQNGTLWPYVGSKDLGVRERLFACPSDLDPRIALWSDDARTFQSPRNFSYNFSRELHDPGAPFPGAHAIGVNLGNVSGADHKIFVAEQATPTLEACDFPAYLTPVPNIQQLATRHFGCANMGMGDGHVELFPPTFPRPPGTFVVGNSMGTTLTRPLALQQYQYYIQLPR